MGDVPSGPNSVAYYNSARAELIQRITLRDQMLVAYVVALGGYLTFLLQSDQLAKGTLYLRSIYFLGLPTICVVFSCVVLNHHVIIGKIRRYVRFELFPNTVPPHWDCSKSLYADRQHVVDRVLGQAFILLLPLLYGVVFAFDNAELARQSIVSTIALIGTVSVDVVALGCCAWLHWKAYDIRKRAAASPPE